MTKYGIYIIKLGYIKKYSKSKGEVSRDSLSNDLLASVLHLASPSDSLCSLGTLNIDLGVLLPASHIRWHINFDCFL